MKYLVIIVSLHFALSDICAQQTRNAQSLSKTIDSIVLNQKSKADIPGLAVGVITNHQIVYKKAYGVQSLSSHKALSSRSDFHMASVSKPFAATAILQLVESGKLNLNSTVSFYLPYFKMKDERYKQITLYHILTHSSGIPDVSNYEWENPQNDDNAAERYVKSFAQMDLDFTPGSKFNYSNAAFDILADVIAKSAGMSFEEYMHKKIFTPAGMVNSSFSPKDISSSYKTSPHIIDPYLLQSVSKVYPYNRIHAPSSTLHSNIDDMLKWATLYLDKGAVNGQEIIKRATWENMLESKLEVNEQYKVCFSWFEMKVGAKKIYFHSGGDLGYRTFVGFEPESGIAVVLMGNNDRFDAVDPALAIFKSIILNTPLALEQTPIYLELRKYILKEGISKVKEVYFLEKKQHPGKYDFGAKSVVTLADWLYDRGYKQQAIDVLIFCTEIEPGVSLWYEYTGDVYSAQGNKQKASEWFHKALTIDPSKKGIEQKIHELGL